MQDFRNASKQCTQPSMIDCAGLPQLSHMGSMVVAKQTNVY